MSFKQSIKEARLKVGLSQEKAGKAIFRTRNAIKGYEEGISSPNPDQLVTLCKLYKTTPNDLLEFQQQNEEAKMKHAELIRILDYNENTGIFIWKINPAKNVKIGDTAGNVDSRGYIVIRIKGKAYKAHRLAWFYMTGEWPKYDIDHDDRVKTNNIFSNLKDSTKSENMKNRKKNKNNTSGFNGVYWDKEAKKWRVRIMVEGKLKHIGFFEDVNAAAEARLSANKQFNYHLNHGEL